MLSAPLIPRFATNATAGARRSAIRHSGAIMKADAAKHLPISESKPRQIGILAYPGIELLDAIGPLEVFASANRILAERSSRNPVAYEIEIWADRLGAIDGSSGVGWRRRGSLARPDPSH